jgi:hypothetical protein
LFAQAVERQRASNGTYWVDNLEPVVGLGIAELTIDQELDFLLYRLCNDGVIDLVMVICSPLQGERVSEKRERERERERESE